MFVEVTLISLIKFLWVLFLLGHPLQMFLALYFHFNSPLSNDQMIAIGKRITEEN